METVETWGVAQLQWRQRKGALMIRTVFLTGLLCVAVAACGSQQPGTSKSPVFKRNTNAALAGRTLQCSAQGPVEALTFAKDGTVAGRFLGTDASGDWFALENGAVEVHLDAGPVSVRDVLRRSGTRWSGRNISCS